MKRFNAYIENIDRIEFPVTYECICRCKHCVSADKRTGANSYRGHIDIGSAIKAIDAASREFNVQSVMTFGGESLLYPDAVFSIMNKAAACEIPVRQLITNGGTWLDEHSLALLAEKIIGCGVTEVLLSVDSFHKEFISLKKQHMFAAALVSRGFKSISLSPAWVTSKDSDNMFNYETRQCLDFFSDLGLAESTGNVITPDGNAKRYLESYFSKGAYDYDFKCGDAPYTDELNNVHSISIEPDGSVCVCSFPIGNIKEKAIIDILAEYDPLSNPVMRALIKGGIRELKSVAFEMGCNAEYEDYYSPCDFCRGVSSQLMGN